MIIIIIPIILILVPTYDKRSCIIFQYISYALWCLPDIGYNISYALWCLPDMGCHIYIYSMLVYTHVDTCQFLPGTGFYCILTGA